MQRRDRRRGTVILMVIGLLTIIGMLGASLLIVTHLDALQSRAMAARTQVAPTTEGFATAMITSMGADRWVKTGLGPYGASEIDAAGWLQYVDWYSTTTEANGWDAWLGAIWYGLGGASLGQVDTDGDGTLESNLYACAVMNILGDAYYMAVRPVDLSGLICLNTAGTPDPNYAPPNSTAPVNVNLLRLLGQQYGPVHLARCDANVVTTLNQYNTECALRLLQPASPAYRPFAIGEEMYLRWLQSPSPTETGRLYAALPPTSLPIATRKLLTTFSSSSVFLRRPAVTGSTWPKDDFHLRLVPDTTTAAGMQETYKRMLAVLEETGLGGNGNVRKRMAAAFTANLKAYQSTGQAEAPWKFTPKDGTGTDEPFTAYGLVGDLVITEVYASHKPSTNPGPPNSDDWIWGCAIELMNPTGSAVNLSNPHQYKLKGTADGNASWEASLSGTIPPNGRKLVLWNYQKGPNAGGMTQADVGLPNPAPAGWSQVNNLSLLNRAKVVLVRVHGADEVPVDEVSAEDDLKYAVSDVQTEGTKTADIRRDDDLNRARYNVAAYASASGGHKLGQDNFAASDPLLAQIDAKAKYPVPILRTGGPVEDLGELLRLYFTGPRKDGSALKSFPMGVRDETASALFGNVRARGRLDVAPTNVGYGGYAVGPYPDVPAGCLLGEFLTLVPPDATRDYPPARVYGRVNVNTAPAEVLNMLPFPARIQIGASTVPVEANTAADYIVAYRDRRATADGRRNYTNRAAQAGANITGLRTAAGSGAEKCFLSPDEVAIPLADYANTLMGWTNYASENTSLTLHPGYLDARDALFRAVSNVITVNTDVVAFTIHLQMGNPAKATWRYVLVADRGNCRAPGDVPAILLLAEVK